MIEALVLNRGIVLADRGKRALHRELWRNGDSDSCLPVRITAVACSGGKSSLCEPCRLPLML